MNTADANDIVEPAREARGLIRRAVKATLATLGSAGEPRTAGWPSAALVTVATGCDGSPILLLSTLAHHTQNLLSDARASLLIEATAGFANPQAGPRVTVMGRMTRTEDESLARRFLARHPGAKAYAGFGDFAFYTMAVERLHYIGGFARARWIEWGAAALGEKGWIEIAQSESDILDHMNRDHGEALRLYGQKLAGQRGRRFALIGVDPEGFDLRCGQSVCRIDFPQPVYELRAVRQAFVELAETARRL